MNLPTFLRICVLAILAAATSVAGVSVMSVDLGSEWMKVAVVSPGVPMEIALNTESSRKTPVAIAFRDGERMVGDTAVNIGARFPEKSYFYLLDLLGKSVDNPAVKLWQERFPYHKITPHPVTNTPVLHHPEGMEFTPEELVAMILEKARLYAENAVQGEQRITDVVITVPVYFTQSERRSLVRAAELAGLKVLQLLNQNTAVALNYGVFRRKDFNLSKPTNILFYDQGASSTVATVVSYQLLKTKDKGYTETNPQLSVKGVGYDRTLGGFEMQLRLRDHLVKLFAEKSKKPLDKITSNKRAMGKLLKEAGRLKKVLSANTEHNAQVENVMDDIDLRAPVQRQEYEELNGDLLSDRITRPIDDALKSAGMTLNDIDQIIVVGGNTRTPKIQESLTKYYSKGELGKSVNADEAAALGAAYQAAYLSKGFKVKTFHVKDAALYPIQVEFSREIEAEDGTKSIKNFQRTLFGRNNPFPQRKLLTFTKHTGDFDFFVNYGDLSFLPERELEYIPSKNISRVSVSGVEAVLAKHGQAENIESKGIKAHFKMDESGLLTLENIEALFEEKVVELVPSGADVGQMVGDAIANFGSKLGKLFGRGENADAQGEAEAPIEDQKDEPPKTDQQEEKSSEEKDKTANDTADGSKESNKSEKANTTAESDQEQGKANLTQEAKKEVKVKTIRESLSRNIALLDLQDPQGADLEASRKKLKDLDAKELEKLAREQARNNLESFILETKNKLYENEYEVASTDEERGKISNDLTSASEWLEYESDASEAKSFKDKLDSLKQTTKGLFERVREHRHRPEALEGLQKLLNVSQGFLDQINAAPKEQQIFTEVEITVLTKLIDDTRNWRDNKVGEQSKLKLSDNPVLLISDIAEKAAALDREVKYLLNKARTAPPPTSPPPPTTTSNQQGDDSSIPKSSEASQDDSVKSDGASKDSGDSSKDVPKSEDQQQGSSQESKPQEQGPKEQGEPASKQEENIQDEHSRIDPEKVKPISEGDQHTEL